MVGVVTPFSGVNTQLVCQSVEVGVAVNAQFKGFVVSVIKYPLLNRFFLAEEPRNMLLTLDTFAIFHGLPPSFASNR